MTRRAMLGALARACAGLLIAGSASARATGPLPDPPAGIDASHLPPPLFSCSEDGIAMHCEICQGQIRLGG